MGGALNQAFGLVTSQRSYRRPVIVLAAAAYNEAGFKDVNATATSIKEDGIKIVVLNYAENDIVLTNALKGLASEGYYYISSQDDLISSVAYGLTQSK
uniref:Uncharacterized protein n=1 Tax=Panagrolaimus superbus TaxID=310955 RepID=A0A914YDM4_9BILA